VNLVTTRHINTDNDAAAAAAAELHVQKEHTYSPCRSKSTSCHYDPTLTSMSPYDLPNNHPDKVILRGQMSL